MPDPGRRSARFFLLMPINGDRQKNQCCHPVAISLHRWALLTVALAFASLFAPDFALRATTRQGRFERLCHRANAFAPIFTGWIWNLQSVDNMIYTHPRRIRAAPGTQPADLVSGEYEKGISSLRRNKDADSEVLSSTI
jgi:hypothetical protein